MANILIDVPHSNASLMLSADAEPLTPPRRSFPSLKPSASPLSFLFLSFSPLSHLNRLFGAARNVSLEWLVAESSSSRNRARNKRKRSVRRSERGRNGRRVKPPPSFLRTSEKPQRGSGGTDPDQLERCPSQRREEHSKKRTNSSVSILLLATMTSCRSLSSIRVSAWYVSRLISPDLKKTELISSIADRRRSQRRNSSFPRSLPSHRLLSYERSIQSLLPRHSSNLQLRSQLALLGVQVTLPSNRSHARSSSNADGRTSEA
jgi:hypothetical protein